MFLSLLKTLRFLKENYNFFHRDISSNNLLFKDGNIKICDFGLSQSYEIKDKRN